jgi:glucose-6-phosphate 1-epimerase
MSIVTRTDLAGNLNFTLTSGESEVVVSAFGGQMLSWTLRGVPILFENRERAVVDGKTAYRGGAPICFPYFGNGSLLPLATALSPQHGHARTTVWDSHIDEPDGGVILTTRQPAPEGYGPTEFTCKLVYSLADRLIIQATVCNVGNLEAPFQLAVHGYWSTGTPSDARVKGIGNRFLDKTLGYAELREEDSSVGHQPPFDRIYLDACDRLELTTERFRISLSTKGCSAAVLWNPGQDHGLSDLGHPDFICVEGGQIDPALILKPREEHKIEIAVAVESIP